MKYQFTEQFRLTLKGRVEHEWRVTDYQLDPWDDKIEMEPLFYDWTDPYVIERYQDWFIPDLRCIANHTHAKMFCELLDDPIVVIRDWNDDIEKCYDNIEAHKIMVLFMTMSQLFYYAKHVPHTEMERFEYPYALVNTDLTQHIPWILPTFVWCGAFAECDLKIFTKLLQHVTQTTLRVRWCGMTVWSFCFFTHQLGKCEELLRGGYQLCAQDRKACRKLLCWASLNETILEKRAHRLVAKVLPRHELKPNTQSKNSCKAWYKHGESVADAHYNDDNLSLFLERQDAYSTLKQSGTLKLSVVKKFHRLLWTRLSLHVVTYYMDEIRERVCRNLRITTIRHKFENITPEDQDYREKFEDNYML